MARRAGPSAEQRVDLPGHPAWLTCRRDAGEVRLRKSRGTTTPVADAVAPTFHAVLSSAETVCVRLSRRRFGSSESAPTSPPTTWRTSPGCASTSYRPRGDTSWSEGKGAPVGLVVEGRAGGYPADVAAVCSRGSDAFAIASVGLRHSENEGEASAVGRPGEVSGAVSPPYVQPDAVHRISVRMGDVQ